MSRNHIPFALALTLALGVGACAPVTTYTDAEAPKRLKLDSTTVQFDARFAPGTANLSAGDAAHLRQLAATGSMGPADRIIVSVAGASGLAKERAGTIASLLLHYGIVPVVQTGQPLPPDRAIVLVTRTLVTLPPCPNWSKPSGTDFGNQPSSNFGCSVESNLGMMVANPSDLASGLPVGPADGRPAAAAINRYLNDKVSLPTANTQLPVAYQNNVQGGGSTSSGSGNATDTGSQ
jgi:pilus assembly protein CpaD